MQPITLIMNHTKITVCIALLLGLASMGTHAQEAIPASGGNATGSGGSISYTIGQITSSSNSGTNGAVSEGVQQPYEILIITALDLANEISLSFSAYPNPTTDFLTLEIDNIDAVNYSFQLYSLNGKLIETADLSERETTISMQNLLPSSYILKVIGEEKEFKTFKIIKR